MERNMSLAELNSACLEAIFLLVNQSLIRQNSCAAVVQTSCSYPAIVKDLEKRALSIPIRAQNPKLLAKSSGLLTYYYNEAPVTKVYSERIWGLKVGDNLMFDTEKYSLQELMAIALNMPMAKLYSDYAVDYYSNGEIKYSQVKPISCVNEFRRPPLSDWKTISIKQAKAMFPKQMKDIPSRLRTSENTKVLMDKNAGKLIMVFDETSDVYIPFNCALHGNGIRYKGSFKMSGNIHSVFAAFAHAVRNGKYETLSEDLRTVEQVYYENGQQKTRKIKLMIGFADIPYDKAIEIVCKEDMARLKQMANQGTKRFSLTAEGRLLDSAKVRTSFFFDSDSEEQIILAPQEVFERWGKEFSPQFLKELGAARKFDYANGDKFLLNIAGSSPKNQSVELQRILAMPSIGIKTLDGVDVAQLGQEILEGKLSVAEACKKYNKIATLVEEMVESTYTCEGVHFSSPERHSRLTGAYSGKVYSDRVVG